MVSGYLPQTAIQRPQNGLIVKLTRKSDTVPTDVVLDRLPDIFDWLPIGGETVDFNVSLSFDGQPSGSFSFIAHAEDRLLIQQQLALGSEFEAFGVGWRISSLAIAEAPASEQPVRPIAVNVSLGGKYENYLSRPLPLITSSLSSSNKVDPDCTGQKDTQTERRLNRSSSVQKLALIAGVSFFGVGDWGFDIASEVDTSETVTLGNKISELEFSNGAFPVYSDPKYIKAVSPQAVKRWTIGEDLIIGAISLTISGFSILNTKPLIQPTKKYGFRVISGTLPSEPIATKIPPLQVEPPPVLVNYFSPRHKLEGDFIQKEELVTEAVEGDKPRWRRKSPKIKEIIEDAENAMEAPGKGFAGDINQNFDQSGPQKVWKKTKYRDGVEVSSHTKVYGYAFLGSNAAYWSDNTSSWKTNLVNGAWVVIKELKTKHDFESQYGFHLGYETTGWGLQRLRQESSGVPETAVHGGLEGRELTSDGIGPLLSSVSADEALEIPETDLRNSLGQIAGLFSFSKVKYIEEEAKTLEPLKRYYKDSEIPFNLEDPVKVCLPNGTSKFVSEQSDPYQTPEYFVSLQQTFKSSFLEAINPELKLQNRINTELAFTDDEKQDRAVEPKLSTGSITLEEKRVILDPSDESHTIYTSTYSAQGPGFRKKLQQTSLERIDGRPDTALFRLPSLYYKEEIKDDGNKEKEVAEPEIFEHWIESPGEVPTGLANAVGGTLSYSNCDTVAKARQAAEYDLWKRNVTGLGTKTITVARTLETQLIREGDIIDLTVNNIKGAYRVTGLSYSLKLQGVVNGKALVTCPGIQLTIVPEPVITLTYSKEKPKTVEPFIPTAKPETQVTVLKDFIKELKYADTVTSRINPQGRKL